MPTLVAIPLSALLSPDLTPATKLVWMSQQIEPGMETRELQSPSRIQREIGICRPTARKALRRLTAGWRPRVPLDVRGLKYTVVDVNLDLIRDKSVPGIARVLYPILRALTQRKRTAVLSSYADIARITHLQPRTVRLAIRALVNAGWLAISQVHQRATIRFSFPNPKAVSQKAEVRRAKQRLEKSKFRGETLALLWCDALVADANYRDDHFPKSLTNPETNQSLQADRYYVGRNVAIEFDGPQHDGPTPLFSETETKRQIARDKLKREICRRQRIPLITLRPEDLTFQRLQAMLGSVLPLLDLTGEEPVIGYLERESAEYLKAISHIRRQAASTGRDLAGSRRLQHSA